MKKIKMDPKRCMTCHTCEIACAINHTECEDIDDFLTSKPAMHNRLNIVIKKDKPHAQICVHCKKPKCIEVCEYDAISKLEDGRVIFLEDKCTGCWECIEACPFDAVSKIEARNISIKCDLCGNGDVQACVTSCPTEALSVTES